MKKTVWLGYSLLSSLIISLSSHAQTKLGMSFALDYNLLETRQVIKNAKPFNGLVNIKHRPFIGGNLGFTVSQPVARNLEFETQFNVGMNGAAYRATNSVDSNSSKVKGNYVLYYAQIPLHLIIQFPDKEYSASKFIGFGPTFYFNAFGNSRQKTDTLVLQKGKLKFGQDAERIRYGVDAFVGFEGSESSSIRAGIYYDVSGFQTVGMSCLNTHQFYLRYSTYF